MGKSRLVVVKRTTGDVGHDKGKARVTVKLAMVVGQEQDGGGRFTLSKKIDYKRTVGAAVAKTTTHPRARLSQ